MKKTALVFFTALLALGTTVHAQLQQGYFLVGGDIGKLGLDLNEGSKFNFNLSPKLAFFVKNNVALGAYINFGLATERHMGSDITYGVGALGRYYVSKADANPLGHSRLFFEGTVGIDGENTYAKNSTNGLGLSFGPGIAHFITSNVGLEALVKYSGIVGFGNRTTTSNLVLGIGLQIYLPSGLGKSKGMK